MRLTLNLPIHIMSIVLVKKCGGSLSRNPKLGEESHVSNGQSTGRRRVNRIIQCGGKDGFELRCLADPPGGCHKHARGFSGALPSRVRKGAGNASPQSI